MKVSMNKINAARVAAGLDFIAMVGNVAAGTVPSILPAKDTHVGGEGVRGAEIATALSHLSASSQSTSPLEFVCRGRIMDGVKNTNDRQI
jgi:hypothetical protein